ncbi:Extracellular dioxygenase [Phytophthora palmivora]|uniref:Extracellular dioxygenase n=1 Tax=Phytophthora palmivora TaxID=4796 RepID=A0A2P4Y8D9_9STRA|nr:Extracellular dioxygenase [Phytophthora palmivora]
MTSIFPGHYQGRATHLHFVGNYNGKVLTNNTYSGGSVVHVGQFFFDDSLIAKVEKVTPYSTNTQAVTSNVDDMWLIKAAKTGYDPIMNYALLSTAISDGVFVWISLAVDLTAEYEVDAVSTLTGSPATSASDSGSGSSMNTTTTTTNSALSKFGRVSGIVLVLMTVLVLIKNYLDESAGKDKDRVTLMVLGDSIGTKYDPFMVLKPNHQSLKSEPERILHSSMALVINFGVSSVGSKTAELTIQFLIYHFSNRRNREEPILLLLDEFSGHWRTDVLIIARLLNVERMAIPAGYTFACQPADISWNKPLKDMLRKNWVEYMLQQLQNSRSSVPFKLKAPTRHERIGWTKDAWKSLSTTVIMSGFSKAQIIPKSSYSSQLNESDQRLLCIEPDWELFNTLLDQIPVVRHVVDPSRDIDTLASNRLESSG